MITDYRKQSELIDAQKFNETINVIGVGALGSWVALILLKMGFKNIKVYDFDDIEEHNVPNQLYREQDIGKQKATAMQDIYKDFFNDEESRLKISTKKITEENSGIIKGIVMCCVDTMKSRKELYEHCFKYGKATQWIEGRIGLFGAYVYTLNDKTNEVFEKYEKTLYADEEAEVSACGISQTALPAAINAASTMVMEMIATARGNYSSRSVMYQMPDYLNITERYDSEYKKEQEVA